MKKLIFLLLLLPSVLFSQFNTEQKLKVLTTNVWDTIVITTRSADAKSIKIKGTGSFIVSFPQWPLYNRDTTRSYEVYTSTDVPTWSELPYDVTKVYVTSTTTCTLNVYTYYDKTQSRNWGASGATTNLSGYAYKDSVNTYSMHQIMDSVTVTRLATIDTLNVSTSINLPDGINKINWGATGSIYSSSGDLWLNGTTRVNSIGILVGDGNTGEPFLTKSGTASNVHYGFYNDYNSGLLRNSADNISLVTGGTARFTTTTATNTSTLPLIVLGTTSYVLFPNLDTTQRDALTPSAGMVIWNTSTEKLQVYVNGITGWVDLH